MNYEKSTFGEARLVINEEVPLAHPVALMSRAQSTVSLVGGTDFYQTTDIDFGAYLIATESLRLNHIEPRQHHCVLCFSDPGRQGQRLFIDFNTKDLQVSARLLLETRTSLLNQICGLRG